MPQGLTEAFIASVRPLFLQAGMRSASLDRTHGLRLKCGGIVGGFGPGG